MHSIKRSQTFKMSALLILTLLLICGCASKPQPPVVADPVKLTPLPASVRSINSRSSESYLQKASNWRARVEQLFDNETQK